MSEAEDTYEESTYERGRRIRTDVLGCDHVARSLDDADGFIEPLQRLVTKYCWGEVWSRNGLDRRTRSMINLAMLTALNRPNELRLHVRAAINNGCTTDEIREVLLQTTIYCGVPAALDAFRVSREELGELGLLS